MKKKNITNSSVSRKMPQRHDTAGEIIETTPPVCDGPSGVLFDLQKLGKYIRPKENRLYKVRKKSAKLRKDMDLLYPMN